MTPTFKSEPLRWRRSNGLVRTPGLQCPYLAEFLSNAQSGIEWTYASNALKVIDPEAAARAGVK